MESTTVEERAPEPLAERVLANQHWYHTMELAPGVVTPGRFDLRAAIARFPWPDVRGKRVLDVATYDGQLAFEMERRGASEVVATDVATHADWDFNPRERSGSLSYLHAEGGVKGQGFEIAKEALGSRVTRHFVNVYDLDPDLHGTFDVVVCGSLLLHLRDPFRALAALHSVCHGELLSIEQIDPLLTLTSRRRPVFAFRGANCQWMVPNTAAHNAMLEVAGFDVVAAQRTTVEAFGPSHPRVRWPWVTRLATRAVAGGIGVPVHAVRARAVQLP
ncbi:MAG: tRNA (mo5U34)-methyltransferase [Frankiales bacterium]|nr:tRNA (mo5U34)-methyltransferase [Frankiales bacterium]